MNAKSLEMLYDRHAAGLFQYALGILRDEHAAKDVLQDVFIRLARLFTLDATNEKAWIYRMAHNAAVDALRRATVRAAHVAEEEMSQLGHDADAALIGNRLALAFEALPPEQRSVAELHLRQEMTFDQIARVQGIPLNTATSRYRYAMEKLRAHLRPIYEELK